MKKLLCIIMSFATLACGLSSVHAGAADEKVTKQIDNAEGYFTDWSQTGAARGYERTDYMEGDGCFSFDGTDMKIVCGLDGLELSNGLNAERYFEFWFNTADPSLIEAGQSRITFYKDDKTYFASSTSVFSNLKAGWNKIIVSLALADSSITSLDRIEFRIVLSEQSRVMLDDLSFTYSKTVSNRSGLDAQLELAENFDKTRLSDKNAQKLEKLIDRAENDLRTQRDAEALAADIKSVMETEKVENKFDGVITSHGRTFYNADGDFEMHYSAAGFSVRFYGTELKAKMKPIRNPHGYGENDDISRTYINLYTDMDRRLYEFNTDYAVDNRDAARAALADYDSRCPHLLIDHEGEYVLAEGLEEGYHTVTVLKRNEVVINKGIIMSDLSTDGEFLTPPKKSTRRIEVIGDSDVTAFGNMALHEGYTAESQDATVSFAGYIADAFGAEYTMTARCGAYTDPAPQPSSRQPEFFTNTYFYTDYWNNGDNNFDENNPSVFSYVSPEKLYDFTEADNDVVIVHLGDNDVWAKDEQNEDECNNFIRLMTNFLRQVRLANPNAAIIYTFSMNMGTHREWTRKMVEKAVADGDSNIYYVDLKNWDTNGGSAHPSMKVHKGAAEEVIQKIKEVTGWEGVMHEVYADPYIDEGKLNISDDYAVAGSKVTFTAEGDAKNVRVSGYGKQVEVTEENGVYSFIMPDFSVMIEADISSAKYGDATGDGKITIPDALTTLQIAVKKIQASEIQKKVCDVNGDGEITIPDALLVLQRAVGKIDQFPVEKK